MSEDSCRLPPGSLSSDGQGRSLLSRWVLGHLEGMASRAEAREANESAADVEIEYINGIAIGRGRCVVDDDGLVVPVSKCTVKELRAEATARGTTDAAGMKRPELTALIKAARARLPFNVLQAQVTVPRAAAGRKTAAKPAAAGAKRKGTKGFYREIWSIDERYELSTEPTGREVMGAEQFLLGSSALDALDATDDQYGVAGLKAMMGVNFEAVMEARMLDEGTAAILNVGDEDVTTGFATLLPGVGDEMEEEEEDDEAPAAKEGELDDKAWHDEAPAAKEGELDDKAWRAMEREAEGMALGNGTEHLQEGYSQLVMMEAQQIDTDEANLVAGMDIAMDVVRAAEICGGTITPADVLTLAAGAQAERSPAAAAAVAARLSVLLQSSAVDGSTGQQYSREFVLQQYEQLADMCLRFRAPVFADAVLEAAETQGLRPSPEIMQRLMVAMRGKPRRSERVSRESAALLDRAGIDTAAEEDEEQIRMQQQQLAAGTAAAAVTDVAALSAVDQPLLGAAGSSSQQQQQQDEDEEEAELSEDMAEMAALLKGVADANMFRERIEEALTTGGGGLSPEAAAEVMDQPEMVLLEMASWLPQELVDTDEDSSDDEDEDEDAAAAAAGAQGQQEGEEQEQMTLLQLAHACANDSLSPEQQEWLLGQAEEHGLPLMLDESTGKLVWPGTDEYDAWAAEEPEEEQVDLQAMYDAFQEVFAEELAQADVAAENLTQQTVNGDGTWKDINPEEQQQLDSMQAAFLENLKKSGMFDVQQQPAAEGELEGVTVSTKQGAALDIDQQLAALAEQFGPLIEAKRAELDPQLLQERGIDVAAMRLDQPRAGASSTRKLAASSSSSEQQ
ncbi:hypothetical protein OEZ85_011501 [Tetradesmus obliquus]|uniref:Uncharacterized protein n=1 Tax=Tetradesmus obliquus TaxID=3088 RepID=A0ABY8TQI7_TETOB|nr:hypothetical protein OEZ85_011501 [Tetradesmus obliquus]